MAINRQDYQYVRNTLPTKGSKISSNNELNLGDLVDNVLESGSWTGEAAPFSRYVGLKRNTTYVIQIINRIESSTGVLASNSIADLAFYEYFFFKTPSTEYPESPYPLVINGIDKEDLSNIFIFESDLPWVVNKKGVVVGLNPIKLKTLS